MTAYSYWRITFEYPQNLGFLKKINRFPALSIDIIIYADNGCNKILNYFTITRFYFYIILRDDYSRESRNADLITYAGVQRRGDIHLSHG